MERDAGTYAVPPDVLAASPHVFPYHVGGERVFVKKRRRNKNPLGKLAQKLVYALTDNALVIPTGRPTGGNVLFEAGMLRRLAERGVRVPRVLHVAPDYFVMSDVGETLESVLKREPEKRRHYIEKAVRELRKLHDLRFAHGGSQIKNLAVRDGDIYFLDFEEHMPDKHLCVFQLRDLFLFLFSLERNNLDPDLELVASWYDGDSPKHSLHRLRRELLRMRSVKLFGGRPFGKLNLRDIRCLCRLVAKAERSAAASRSSRQPAPDGAAREPLAEKDRIHG